MVLAFSIFLFFFIFGTNIQANWLFTVSGKAMHSIDRILKNFLVTVPVLVYRILFFKTNIQSD
jgi:hypothetical protein